MNSFKILTLGTVIFLVKADPKCTTYGKTDVICVADETNYVLRRGLVSDADDTTGITLRNCKITDVDYESFTDLPKLKYIDLSYNKISSLKLGVLDEPIQVTYLNISYNQIVSFPLGLFDQLKNIDVLDLKGNKINDIELGVFDPLQKLRHVDLSSNAIIGRNLNPYIFDQNPLIKFLDFSRNDMSGSSDELTNACTVLEFLNLDRCSLDTVPKFATRSNLKTLKHLILSSNRINNLDDPGTFVHLVALEKLNFDDNVVESLNENVFQPLKNLRVIILRNNKLTTISEKQFQNLPKLGTIVMSHNSLESVPVNALRGTSLKTLILSYNRLTYLQDNFCLELKNSGSTLKKFLFNNNPWQCACLNDILKEVKKYDIIYDNSDYKGEKPTCVTTQDFNCKRQPTFNDFFIEIYENTL